MAQQTPAQVLEEQRKRLQSLQERKTRLEIKLETEAKALADARAEALTEFKTSELDELRALYHKVQEENGQALVAFILELDSAESALADLERQTAV
jgi:hypothetical protein